MLEENTMPKFPDFHKKNISKRQDSQQPTESVIKETVEQKVEQENYGYPFKTLYLIWKGDDYPELAAAVEYYNQSRYDTALKLFKQKPPHPARFFKNLVCTFHGPIGWLLMANTKINKDRYVNFCIGCCQYHLDNYSEALNSISSDWSEEATYLRAWCQYKLGIHSESKKNFKKVFMTRPEFLRMKFPYTENEIEL
jgi:tetratricopeptide (TPR) repeat protein